MAVLLYSAAFIFLFLSYSQELEKLPVILTRLGTNSFGIYLSHYLILTVAAKAAYHFFPWLLGQQWLYQPVLLAIGLVIPSILTSFGKTRPAKMIGRYVFG